MVVISSTTRSINYRDSGRLYPELDIMDYFFHLIALHLGRDLDPRDRGMRLQGSTKQDVGRGDCSIFFGANVMSIAFRYTLKRDRMNILNQWRK